jgi:hypothetical protein
MTEKEQVAEIEKIIRLNKDILTPEEIADAIVYNAGYRKSGDVNDERTGNHRTP